MRALSTLALLAALTAAGTAGAQDRVVVGTGEDLAGRIRGQTGDLPLTLVDAPAPADLEAALALGRNRDAPWVVFAVEGDAAITVHVVEVAERRMLSRRIDDDGGRSAMLEAAALVVRGALRDLSEGGHVGVVVPAPAAAPEPIPAADPPAPAPVVPGRAVAVRVELGWAAAIDGHAPEGVQSPSLAGVVLVDRLRVGVRVEVSLPVTLEDAQVSLEILRLRPTAVVAVDLLDDPELALTVGAELAALLWHRATAVRGGGLEATDARWSASLLVAPELGLEWFPAALDGILGLLVTAGADIAPSAPTFADSIDGATVERAALWPVQPFARLALAVRGR